MNITDNKSLLQKYDILELMVAQIVVEEINNNIEPYINQYLKNIDDIKSIRVHIWVNKMFYDILTDCKIEDKKNKTNFYRDFFKYQLNFEQNCKMKQGQYEFYSIAIITKENYVKNM